MQVTETLSQGLKREFQVVLPASELEERLTSELSSLKDRVRINGFRPGKVPVAHLRRLYGRSVMAEMVQTLVGEAERKIVDENALKPAGQPRYEFPEDKEEMEKALDAKADLSFKVALEILPQFELADMSDITVRKPVTEVTDKEVDETLQRMAAQNRSFDSAEGRVAESGDRVMVDFVGTMDGEAFEGGTAQDISVDLGSDTFIPGFEDQLVGVKAGDEKTVTVTFPANYGAAHLAGKEASFAVTVKDVQARAEAKIDDDLAKQFGMESLDAMKDAIREAVKRDLDAQSRRKVKKALLDALDREIRLFELPPQPRRAGVNAVFGSTVHWSDLPRTIRRPSRMTVTTSEEANGGISQGIARAPRWRYWGPRPSRRSAKRAKSRHDDDEVTQLPWSSVCASFPGRKSRFWEFYSGRNPFRASAGDPRPGSSREKVVTTILNEVTVRGGGRLIATRSFADEEEESTAASGREAEGQGCFEEQGQVCG